MATNQTAGRGDLNDAETARERSEIVENTGKLRAGSTITKPPLSIKPYSDWAYDRGEAWAKSPGMTVDALAAVNVAGVAEQIKNCGDGEDGVHITVDAFRILATCYARSGEEEEGGRRAPLCRASIPFQSVAPDAILSENAKGYIDNNPARQLSGMVGVPRQGMEDDETVGGDCSQCPRNPLSGEFNDSLDPCSLRAIYKGGLHNIAGGRGRKADFTLRLVSEDDDYRVSEKESHAQMRLAFAHDTHVLRLRPLVRETIRGAFGIITVSTMMTSNDTVGGLAEYGDGEEDEDGKRAAQRLDATQPSDTYSHALFDQLSGAFLIGASFTISDAITLAKDSFGMDEAAARREIDAEIALGRVEAKLDGSLLPADRRP